MSNYMVPWQNSAFRNKFLYKCQACQQYSCVMFATHLHGITGQIGLNFMEFFAKKAKNRDNNGDTSKYRHYIQPLEQRMSGDD